MQEFPRLPGAFNATRTKTVMQFLAYKTEQIRAANPADEHVRLRAACLAAWASMIEQFDYCGRFFTEDEARLAYQAGRLFLVLYQRLANRAIGENRRLWKVLPKHHYIDHQIRRLKKDRFNPRYRQCFLDEDWMGKVKKIASKTHGASTLHRFIDRYLLHIGFRWSKKKRAGRCFPARRR